MKQPDRPPDRTVFSARAIHPDCADCTHDAEVETQFWDAEGLFRHRYRYRDEPDGLWSQFGQFVAMSPEL